MQALEIGVPTPQSEVLLQNHESRSILQNHEFTLRNREFTLRNREVYTPKPGGLHSEIGRFTLRNREVYTPKSEVFKLFL